MSLVDQLSTAKLNDKQKQALGLLANDARYTMLHGGGGSGKSFVICLALIVRCLLIPNSTHGVFRRTGVSLKNSIFNDTFRAALRTFDPDLAKLVRFNSADMEIHFPNGSKILMSGLDDQDRIERLYGMEYCSVWVNEISEIKTFKPVISTLIFRLRQNAVNHNGVVAKKKFWMDCNPPARSSWAYKRFFQHVDDDKNPLINPLDWQELALNTADNLAVIGQDYIDQMKATLSVREQRRLIYGEWLNDNEGALFTGENLDAHRHVLPDDAALAEVERRRIRESLVRVVIAVDPATTAHKKSDLTGINVAGVNEAGHAYVLQDSTGRYTPDQWRTVVQNLYDYWGADRIIAEDNQGGLMVNDVLTGAGSRRLPVKLIRAKIGKLPRAEPVAAMYEKGLVHHVGFLKELENQMEGFGYDFNPSKQGSPDRLDAMVHAITELLLEKQHAPAPLVMGKAAGFF